MQSEPGGRRSGGVLGVTRLRCPDNCGVWIPIRSGESEHRGPLSFIIGRSCYGRIRTTFSMAEPGQEGRIGRAKATAPPRSRHCSAGREVRRGLLTNRSRSSRSGGIRPAPIHYRKGASGGSSPQGTGKPISERLGHQRPCRAARLDSPASLRGQLRRGGHLLRSHRPHYHRVQGLRC